MLPRAAWAAVRLNPAHHTERHRARGGPVRAEGSGMASSSGRWLNAFVAAACALLLVVVGGYALGALSALLRWG